MEEKEGNRGKNSEIRLKLMISESGKIFRIWIENMSFYLSYY